MIINHMVKSITMAELAQLQKDYMSAVEKKQEWIIQAMDIVFDWWNVTCIWYHNDGRFCWGL